MSSGGAREGSGRKRLYSIAGNATRLCACGKPVMNSKTKGRSTCCNCRKGRFYRMHKGNVCERCGFIPEWQGQLDVDHIDGDHNNHKVDNLQTLCANCHRLKSYMNDDYDQRVDRQPDNQFELFDTEKEKALKK